MFIPATNKTAAEIAMHAIAVPKSGSFTMSNASRIVGAAAGTSTRFQSVICCQRDSRKYARYRMSAGFASSDGWKEKPPNLIQRCVLCESRKRNTAISNRHVKPRNVNTADGRRYFL